MNRDYKHIIRNNVLLFIIKKFSFIYLKKEKKNICNIL